MTRDNQGEVRAGNAFPQQEAKKQNYPVPFVIAHFWSTVIVPNWIFCGLHTATIYMSMVVYLSISYLADGRSTFLSNELETSSPLIKIYNKYGDLVIKYKYVFFTLFIIYIPTDFESNSIKCFAFFFYEVIYISNSIGS